LWRFFLIPLLFEPSNPKRHQWKRASNGTHTQVHGQTEGSPKGKCSSSTNFFLILYQAGPAMSTLKVGRKSKVLLFAFWLVQW